MRIIFFTPTSRNSQRRQLTAHRIHALPYGGRWQHTYDIAASLLTHGMCERAFSLSPSHLSVFPHLSVSLSLTHIHHLK